MEQVRKRIRKNDDSNGRAGSGSSDTKLLNDDHGLVQTIPTLVSEIFLEELRDVKLLKTCRLVCKSWSIDASKSLRACSVVSLKENSRTLENFAALLRKRELRSFKHFPSPFQNIRVEGRFFTEPTFINLVFTPNFTCVSLIVVLSDKAGVDIDQSQLSLFLAANKNSIADLTILAKTNPGFQLNETLVNDAIRLTSLKRLKFEDHCHQCPHIQMVQNIMRVCRPTYVNLSTKDYKSLTNLLQQDQVTHIKDLRLFCVGISRYLTHLANTKFQLRALSLYSIHCVSEDVPEWYSFLENVSPLLIQFRMNFRIGNKTRFPKLQEIHIGYYQNILPVFTPHNFPSLTKVSLDVQTSIRAKENFTVPHEGVRHCVIEVRDMTWYHDEDHELFMLLTFVSRQFPSVTSLDFSMSRFQTSTLTDICKAFPSLKTLKVDGECDFFSFADFTTQSLKNDLSVEMIPCPESVLDFKMLEGIKFGSKFPVSPDMIRHCLPRIRKLKHLELHWNSSLSAPLFRDFVGHLDKIVIISALDRFWDPEVQVLKLIPNVVLMQ